MTDIAQRKADHLDLAEKGDVAFKQRTTLLECVELIHDALPELDYDELDASLQLFGKRLRAPILIAAMTGGHPRAERINKELAEVAESLGFAFGLGSQRAMHRDPKARASYDVRSVAPNALLFGNIGVVQARGMKSAELRELVESVGADALCVHLNPAMELVQVDGDRDFRGGLETLQRLSSELPVPVIAKETGCGLSARAGARLKKAGIRHVDVSGAGGTSWVAVETHRARDERKALGETFWDWGIPTAASVGSLRPFAFDTLIATGGVQNGLDAARAIALGAHLVGIARPTLQALDRGGPSEAEAFLRRVESELKTAMLLTGSPNLDALRAAPRILRSELRDWLHGAPDTSGG
ncbi:MAG TPA: type 2 isopentenyl-diphosphate Delta-isomerase [Polyangiaceae bacterium]|nr:type 2 isopentenyl-diphosphate Delta-isomerase [Polyangiaceae bacterium]